MIKIHQLFIRKKKESLLESRFKDLSKISIRGRMAYSISLFENLLVLLEHKTNDWTSFLEIAWSFTSSENFDEWSDLFVEYLPEVVFEDGMNYLEHMTIDEFMKIESIYKKTSGDILKGIELLFKIGTAHAYTTVQNDMGIKSIEYMEEFIPIFEKYNYDIPRYDDFLKFSFEEDKGWGNTFEGKSLSIILNSIKKQ